MFFIGTISSCIVINLSLQIVDYGSEVITLLLRRCLDQIIVKDGETSQLKRDLVTAVIRYLLDRPNFSTNLCEALDGMPISEGFLGDISNALGFSVTEKIGIGLALSDCENPDLRMRGKFGSNIGYAILSILFQQCCLSPFLVFQLLSCFLGQNFCIAQIEELCANPSSILNSDQIQDIVMFLYRTEGLSKHMDSFTKILSLLQSKGCSFFLSAPLLTNDINAANNLRWL